MPHVDDWGNVELGDIDRIGLLEDSQCKDKRSLDKEKGAVSLAVKDELTSVGFPERITLVAIELPEKKCVDLGKAEILYQGINSKS